MKPISDKTYKSEIGFLMYSIESTFFKILSDNVTNVCKLKKSENSDFFLLSIYKHKTIFGLIPKLIKTEEHKFIINSDGLFLPIQPNENVESCIDFQSYSDFVWKPFMENTTNDRRLDILHCTSCMSEETGEILGHINKHIFHSDKLDKAKIISELGDLTWYFAALLRLLDIKFVDVLKGNFIKLTTRYKDGRGRNYLIEKDTNKEDKYIKNYLEKNNGKNSN